MNVVSLYRPVGVKELELIAGLNWQAFPPRLDWQPIFYPVLNQAYAEQIAREWNTADDFSGNCGIVLEFALTADHLKKYDIQNVGGEIHNELWVPAEELADFNKNIIGSIKVIQAFFGPTFIMPCNAEIADILKQYRNDD